ncbi:F-box protein At5g49610-like [Tasmannia lanceolata]|uniref:F-box protein At5g49610-like n=1 Tax=Tasmannia lanceolata TaxID=3420 RepID=UPI0040629D40
MQKQEISTSDLIDTSIGSSFGDDMLMEIFSRLPAKSLFRFKCVSKAWCNLISNDSFQKRLLLTMSGLCFRTRVIIYPNPMIQQKEPIFSHGKARDGSILKLSLSFLPFHPNFRIIDCCNGLILCICGGPKGVTYYICNPVTKEWVALPKPHKRLFLDRASLAYDPSVSPHYKVVCLTVPINLQVNNYISLEIFYSDSGKWVESNMLCDPITERLQSQGAVFLNGILHMVAMDFPNHHNIGINLKEENCRRIECPESERYGGLLGKCKGRLQYAIYDYSGLRIWTLKDCYSNEWVLKHETSIQTLVEKLSLLPICHPSCYRGYSFHLLAFHPDFELLFLGTSCQTYSYNLDSTSLEEIYSVGCEGDYKSCRVFPFTPCLNSLKKATG